MNKDYVLGEIKCKGVVAVVRAGSADEALRVTDACLEGGITAIEITFTVPDAVRVISALAGRYSGSGLILGAGTVMCAADARRAIDAGACFVVSPYFDADTVKLCVEDGTAVMPGVMTVREAVMAMNAGADIIKIFPAELFGPAIIKAFKGPLPSAVMMPTGGVTAQNVGEWIRAGAAAVGAGGSLTSGAKTGDYALITHTAELFVRNITLAREEL